MDHFVLDRKRAARFEERIGTCKKTVHGSIVIHEVEHGNFSLAIIEDNGLLHEIYELIPKSLCSSVVKIEQTEDSFRIAKV